MRTLIVLLVAVSMGSSFARAASGATAAFQKLQSLAGNWEGKDDHGAEVKSEFKSIAGNTGVMETLTASGMDEMVTLYSVDGDSILLLHYCPTNNQPRMRALPPAGDVKQLVFSFQGASNLPSLAIGHEYKLVMQFPDKDHLTERWTWRKNGKDSDSVFQLVRKK